MAIRDRILELRRVPAADLVPNPRNWRRHPEPQSRALRSMLEQIGYADALIARETPAGLELIDGHLRAATTPGDIVPVLVIDVDDAEAAALLATLDPLASMASTDEEALQSLLEDVELSDQGLQALLEELAGTQAPDGLTDPDMVPEVPDEPVTQEGNLWVLGEHRLLCGDSRSADDVARLLDGVTLDLIVTSPPYNVGIDYDAYDDAQVDREGYLAFISEVLGAWVPQLGEGRLLAWNVGVSAKTHHLHQAMLLERSGLSFWRQLTWIKSGVPLPTFQHTREARRARRYSPNYRHEVIYLFGKGDPQEGSEIHLPAEGSDDVWDFLHQSQASRDLPDARSEHRERRRNSGLERHAVKAHPAAFPVKLPETLISYLTAGGEAVADPFCGSGSTLVAAEITGRRGFGLELDPRYVDVAVRRWEKFAGRKAVLEG